MRLFRQLCKHAKQHHHPPTNVMLQDYTDLNNLASRLIKMEQVGENTFRSHNHLQGRLNLEAVYGGQAFSSAVRAASMTVSTDFLPHSAHAYLIKSGNVNRPLNYKVRRVRDGKSFCTRYVDTFQDGDLLTSALISFHVDEESAIRHQVPLAQKYPDPESLKTWSDVLDEAMNDSSSNLTSFHKKILKLKQENTPPIFYNLFDIRPIDPLRWTMRGKYAKEQAPAHHTYMKCKGVIGNDQLDHHVMGAFASDIPMMECVLVDHITDGFFPTMLFSLDHQVYFHGKFSINEWLLVECTSPVAEGGRAYAEARVWTMEGRLVMSISQEGIVRYQKVAK
ncbi:Acyl-coenzyme A thioesterase 8 [Aphelenchoides bicaudatus]|nr:Acyl-coenzyme A thioesterase 8 [Aphelenchoides bicaudatus]